MANGHDQGLDNNPESRLSIHEVPEQISRIFFGKPDVRYFIFWRENSNNHCSIHFQFCQMRLFALNFQQCAMAGSAAEQGGH